MVQYVLYCLLGVCSLRDPANHNIICTVCFVVVVCFQHLSSQLKAASCAWYSSEMPPSKQVNAHSFTICFIVWGSPQSRGDVTRMMLRHGPASDRNLFSILHWPRGRSIPGSWMVRSLIKDLFGTSTIWFCHDVRQRW